MKWCNKCEEHKSLDGFATCNNCPDGLEKQCKQCRAAIRLASKRTKIGLVKSIYKAQISSSRTRGHEPPSYSLVELREWFKAQPNANELYRSWKDSDYNSKLRPSVDRKEDDKGYSMENIQLMTWGDNMKKAGKDKKSGRMKRSSNKSIIQMSASGTFIKTHHSMSEAQRDTGVHVANISACCRGTIKHSGGYTWKYNTKG